MIIIISGLFSTDRICNGLISINNRTKIYSQNSDIDKRYNYFNLDNRYNRKSILPLVRKLENKVFAFFDYSYFRRKKSNLNIKNINTLEDLKKFRSILILLSKIFTKFYFWFCSENEINKSGLDKTINSSSAVLLMWPYDISNINVAVKAKKRKIKTYAFITGFDNISTKSRMPLVYDKVLVWSNSMKNEFMMWYPSYSHDQIIIVGAPQYDVFFNKNLLIGREKFSVEYGFDFNKPICLFCVGSPNLLKEITTFDQLLKIGVFNKYQVILRLHPGFKYEDVIIDKIQTYENVTIDNIRMDKHGYMNDSDIKNWVNSFKNVDVVINSSSTVCLDAVICDTRVINLMFEVDENGLLNYNFINEINNNWFHLCKLLNHSEIFKANTIDELIVLLTDIKHLKFTHKYLIKDFFDDTLSQGLINLSKAIEA